jgi:quinol monooxygenase YgiN
MKYGLIGNFKAKESKGKELANILIEASQLVSTAKGCHHYIVSIDNKEPDRMWVSEIWDTKEDHDNSLKLPGVSELIARAVPLMDGMPQKGTELQIVGGKGI